MSYQSTLLITPKGRVEAVRRRSLGEQPFFLETDNPNNIATIPANGVLGPVPLTVSGMGPAQIFAMGHEKTSNCLVLLEISDGTTTIALSNYACHISTIFGNGLKPYRLPQTIYVDEMRRLRATLTDLSGSSNNVRLALQCQRFLNPVQDPDASLARARLQQKQFITQPYWYTFTNGRVDLTASGTSEQSITIDEQRDFQLLQISATSTGSFTCDIIDSGTGESLIDAPSGQHYEIANNILFGTGNFPLKFKAPHTFRHGQKIIVRLTDTSVAANTVFIALGGRFIINRMWEA